jgi:hypothetical protein
MRLQLCRRKPFSKSDMCSATRTIDSLHRSTWDSSILSGPSFASIAVCSWLALSSHCLLPTISDKAGKSAMFSTYIGDPLHRGPDRLR